MVVNCLGQHLSLFIGNHPMVFASAKYILLGSCITLCPKGPLLPQRRIYGALTRLPLRTVTTGPGVPLPIIDDLLSGERILQGDKQVT